MGSGPKVNLKFMGKVRLVKKDQVLTSFTVIEVTKFKEVTKCKIVHMVRLLYDSIIDKKTGINIYFVDFITCTIRHF